MQHSTPASPLSMSDAGSGSTSIVWTVGTILSLVAGTAVLLPYMGVVLANIMAFAAPRTGDESGLQIALAMSFIFLSTAYPVGLLLAWAGATVGWVTSRPAMAFGFSLVWLGWIAACAAIVALYWLIYEY